MRTNPNNARDSFNCDLLYHVFPENGQQSSVFETMQINQRQRPQTRVRETLASRQSNDASMCENFGRSISLWKLIFSFVWSQVRQ